VCVTPGAARSRRPFMLQKAFAILLYIVYTPLCAFFASTFAAEKYEDGGDCFTICCNPEGNFT
jgi:hypothetical protein